MNIAVCRQADSMFILTYNCCSPVVTCIVFLGRLCEEGALNLLLWFLRPGQTFAYGFLLMRSIMKRIRLLPLLLQRETCLNGNAEDALPPPEASRLLVVRHRPNAGSHLQCYPFYEFPNNWAKARPHGIELPVAGPEFCPGWWMLLSL